ncbi:PqqD family protein [Paramicrobacterium agarici]|uniref:Coenzyme PQQ synthesis protein D (PqqD) n=1 Tax=Paramicrobacterium agarici TaxID=630514 RepID=A0A2A9DWR9_9MICO|nr:PqqD family protein [Microbacterium agarici]PFG30442.1 coenzyme PQQ synthesis protein D (PqqD) [Microbacterium agarici]TQO23455.1 coenzyme PQQ synthesis protein D (PqqD) [Microbacterium agarici]
MKLRTEGVTWQEIDGELVILDLESSVYLTTNVAGAVLAKRLREDRTMADLTGTLTAEFGIDAETAQRDAYDFVQQLREKNLLLEV